MKKLITAIFILLAGSCSKNILNELSSKSSDEALIYDAEKAVNELRYDDAIYLITQKVSASGQTLTSAREVLASGYAGKCGLNFINYTSALSSSASTSTFVLVSAPFVGVAVNPASCLSSLQTLDLIGTNAQRTVSQNSFAAVVGMVLMGSATRANTDLSPVNGDGAQDGANISCAISDIEMNNIVLGYAYMAINFSSLASSLSSSASLAITDAIAVCASVAGASCTNTDPALISAPVRDTMRDLINTTQYGVGTFDASNSLLIPTACP